MGAYACFLLKYDDDFIQNPYSIDRFVFFAQAYESFKTLPWWQKLLGSTLGCSLPEETILPDFYSYVFRFEEMNNIRGLYPFTFHATYLRLLFLLGLPLTISILLYLFIRFFKENRMDVKLFIIVFMLFSTSLSTMTITNGGLMLFLTGIVVLFPERSSESLTSARLNVKG